jgi:signal transduction histidine kinase
MFKTIRTKLLFILVSFILVTITLSVVTFYYYQNSKQSLSGITREAEHAHVLLLKDIKTTHEFFENETINPAFFETGKSLLIANHQETCRQLAYSLNLLDSVQQAYQFGLSDSIHAMKQNFETYTLITADIFKQVLARGFKDYGVEGNMRKYAHELENYKDEIGQVNVLQLRRHEKDFIIRQEDPYLERHTELVEKIKDGLSVNNSVNADTKLKIIASINNYSKEFNTLVDYEKKLGLKSGDGLKKQVEEISDRIENSLLVMAEFSAQKEAAAMKTITLTYLTIGILLLLAGIVSALAISKRVSKSITFLNEKINEFVISDFTQRTVLPIKNSTDEISVLTTNFSIMEQHIVNQMSSLKASNTDLEMLFYATSHDIKSPLLKVKELTASASAKTTDPLIREYLNLINQSWEKLISITDELGIITNIRSSEITIETIDLEKLIRSVFAEFRSMPRFDEIIFSLEVNIKTEFRSSMGLMKAIFRNLIENSIKYSVKRSNFSFLKIYVSGQTDDTLKIEISDNGMGIKKDCHQQIYDIFFRANSEIPGTGLGLYIVKCSIDKLHGTIDMESEEGNGTAFTILLPFNHKSKNIKERIIHDLEISQLNSLALN